MEQSDVDTAVSILGDKAPQQGTEQPSLTSKLALFHWGWVRDLQMSLIYTVLLSFRALISNFSRQERTVGNRKGISEPLGKNVLGK